MEQEQQQVTVDINVVLDITQQRLARVTQENILLESLASQQKEEIRKLKEALDTASEYMKDEANDGSEG